MFANVVCSICTDSYDYERPVAAMPCGHTFHDDCLEKWLSNNRNCPSCRKPLRKNQSPIHKLYFDVDQNSSQMAQSSKASDPIEHDNRKLKAQVTALQSAINKLKSECQQVEDEKLAISCLLKDKDCEIQNLNKVQEKLRRRVRELSIQQDESEKLQRQLNHLKNVQTIIEGVECEVKQMLEEQAGYTPQQLTYVVLLRQQLDNSKKANEKLKKDIYEYKERLNVAQRKAATAESEMDILKLEMKQADATITSLKKKYDVLMKSIDSPRGVARSLADRMISQSPAPQFITPQSNNKQKSSNRAFQANTPTIDNQSSESDGILSPVLFQDDSDVSDVKQTLEFLDDTDNQPKTKKPKLITSKQQLTQDYKGAGDSSVIDTSNKAIKLKSSLILKNRGRLKPINPNGSSAHNSHVKDVTNTQHAHFPTNTGAKDSGESKFFRKGYDGLGGQAQTFNRVDSAIKFNVFKKPVSTSVRQSKSQHSSKQSSVTDYIIIE